MSAANAGVMAASPTRFWAVWHNTWPADWSRDAISGAVLAFESKRDAEDWAAGEYGREDYEGMDGQGLCEVRRLG